MDVSVMNANELLRECCILLLRNGRQQDTRNGKALAMDRPVMVEMLYPRVRIINNPIRKANPYFHVYEAMWMFAGRKDVRPLLPYNAGMGNYADDGVVNGAYGHRWRNHFYKDQLEFIVGELTTDPNSRQAVLGMYDPAVDQHSGWKDRPCNTHIYFRIVRGSLDMLVCNRSNDLIWGLAGSNIVHMTMLQEYVAAAVGCELGVYRVVTNNLHAYEQHFTMLEELADARLPKTVSCAPMFNRLSKPEKFLLDCERIVGDSGQWVNSWWMQNVGVPLIHAHKARKAGDITTEKDMANSIDCPAIRAACLDWEGVK